jgi:NAD(P)-dependent dehydrogenase (short-subunit alcohol dehydrogenase family)
MSSISEKWALVTGSSRGIGRQISLGLAAEGCNVILHARTLDHLAETDNLLGDYGIQTLSVAGDLGTREGLESVIEGVKAGDGRVDILYNNAAVQNRWTELWEIPQSVWEEAFRVNVYAPVALCRAFVPGMKERGFGRIINLTSGIKDIPQLAPYSVSKAAVDKYTLDLAAELRGTNVLANTLDPGWLRTDLGGPNADHEVTTVLPGALVPALLEDHGPSGQRFCAQDFAVRE